MLYANQASVRKRSYPKDILTTGQEVRTSRSSGTKYTTNYSRTISPVQYTWSEGHPVTFIGEQNDIHTDIGGNFLTGRLRLDNPGGFLHTHNLSGGNVANDYTYVGPIIGYTFNELLAYDQPLVSNKSFENTKAAYRVFEDLSSTSVLEARGTQAIARVNPTKQQAGLYVALKETYSDGVPKVPGVSRERVRAALRDYREKRAAGIFKGPAEEYLNFVFGVLPLLSDVRSLNSSIRKFKENYDQFTKNAGKVVRRSYSFPQELKSTTIAEELRTAGWPGVYTNSSLLSNQVLRPHNHYKSVTRRQKFSGAFTYYIENGESDLDKLLKYNAEIDYLLGAGLTVENLWNSSPWTWMVDWYFNAGDILSNLSSTLANDLVLHYGYMQEHTIALHDCDCALLTGKKAGGTVPVTRYCRYKVEAKQRIRATPFGFGLTEAGLSVRQKLILAALGITRV